MRFGFPRHAKAALSHNHRRTIPPALAVECNGMTAKRLLAAAVLALTLTAVLMGAQAGHRRWERYEHEMQDVANDPPGAYEKTEFAFARLRYRSHMDGYFSRYYRWGIDSNKTERIFMQGLRRLTRVHARSVEEIVDIDSDELFEWPWLYAVSVGDWDLTDEHVLRLRKFFERGGFLMVDDFHGERDWARFASGILRILPNAKFVELQDNDPIFHTVYDLNERLQVPGENVVNGPGYEKDGIVPHWRAVLDDKGRIQVAICFNMDLGDGLEFADDPEYPGKFSAFALRLGINYVLYAMTH